MVPSKLMTRYLEDTANPVIQTELARVKYVDIRFEDHESFSLNAEFDYGDAGQNLGYNIDDEFIRSFMLACSSRSLKGCEGAIVQVTIENGIIVGIAPLKFQREGKAFNIKEWKQRKTRRWDIIETVEVELLVKVHPDYKPSLDEALR